MCKSGPSTSGSRPTHYCPGADMMGMTLRDTAAFEYCALPADTECRVVRPRGLPTDCLRDDASDDDDPRTHLYRREGADWNIDGRKGDAEGGRAAANGPSTYISLPPSSTSKRSNLVAFGEEVDIFCNSLFDSNVNVFARPMPTGPSTYFHPTEEFWSLPTNFLPYHIRSRIRLLDFMPAGMDCLADLYTTRISTSLTMTPAPASTVAPFLRPRHFGDAREHILENVDPTIRRDRQAFSVTHLESGNSSLVSATIRAQTSRLTGCCRPLLSSRRSTISKSLRSTIGIVTALGMADNIAVLEFIDCVKGKHEPRRIIVLASSTGIQPQQLPNADRPVKPRHASVAPSITNPSTLIPPMTPTLRLTAAVGYPVPAVYPAVSGFIVMIGPIWMSISEFRFSATSVRVVFAKPSADDQDRRVVHRWDKHGMASIQGHNRAQRSRLSKTADRSARWWLMPAGPTTLTLTSILCERMLRPGRLLRPAQFRPVRLRSRLHSLTHRYGWTVRKTIAIPGIILALTTATFVMTSLLYYDIPKGFFSTEDNCLITSMAIGPDDASFNAILAPPDRALTEAEGSSLVVKKGWPVDADMETPIHVEPDPGTYMALIATTTCRALTAPSAALAAQEPDAAPTLAESAWLSPPRQNRTLLRRARQRNHDASLNPDQHEQTIGPGCESLWLVMNACDGVIGITNQDHHQGRDNNDLSS
ncbi:hypothetical protein CABS01_11752 [Colletotrichum abscissum]|uniref:Transmembrane protein n=1 Tax=Colletotrichum abscissum TaxID=1671311 RepID=A0A9Q0B335_9PEZI|nr:uncharacterized protein CABS01_11752 [Colletotrichum abscissum]KAI3548665.1 hypothetical protein CABS02_08195 [Colletotrichum abscissum]KAK1492855.1 hypothetical protein CABS01_11752 [Colletotrichum abscissum]